MSLLFSTGVIAASGLGAAAPGMVLLTPTSIAYSGTSASVGANGQVTFSAVTSLSLNGVFTADFDNYVVSIRGSMNTGNAAIRLRMRASGTDNSTASSYTRQRLRATGTTVDAERDTGNLCNISNFSSTQRDGFYMSLYGPALAQPTTGRTVTVESDSGARIFDHAFTHNQSTAYDGFTLTPDANNMTGALQVYGVRS